MKEPFEKEKALQLIKNILTGVPLENPEMPGGSRVLKNDLNEIATEIIKIMVLHTFTTTDLDIVLSLVRYRITGQWVDLTSKEKQPCNKAAETKIERHKLCKELVLHSKRNVSVHIDDMTSGVNLEGEIEIVLHPKLCQS